MPIGNSVYLRVHFSCLAGARRPRFVWEKGKNEFSETCMQVGWVLGFFNLSSLSVAPLIPPGTLFPTGITSLRARKL